MPNAFIETNSTILYRNKMCDSKLFTNTINRRNNVNKIESLLLLLYLYIKQCFVGPMIRAIVALRTYTVDLCIKHKQFHDDILCTFCLSSPHTLESFIYKYKSLGLSSSENGRLQLTVMFLYQLSRQIVRLRCLFTPFRFPAPLTIGIVLDVCSS